MVSTPPEPTSTAGQIGQLGRAVAVIDVIADLGVATAAEIGRHLGLAKSTVHRLLAVLHVHGLVARGIAGYRLGERPRGWISGERQASIARLRHLALPYLVELHDRIGTAVALAVWSQDSVAYAERVHSRSQLAEIAPLSPLAPAHATAAGKILLAFAAGDQRHGAERELSAYTHSTITSERALAVELDRVRDAGLATARGELLPTVTAIAAPVTDHRRRVVAAIEASGPAERVLRPAAQQTVRAAAAGLSAALRSAITDPSRVLWVAEYERLARGPVPSGGTGR